MEILILIFLLVVGQALLVIQTLRGLWRDLGEVREQLAEVERKLYDNGVY